MTATRLNGHFARLIELLDLEATAEQQQLRQEIAQQAETNHRSGLTQLVIVGEEIGFGERFLLDLAPKNQQQELPWSRLDSGSPVVLIEETGRDDHPGWRGVVTRKSKKMIQVAFDRAPDPAADRPLLRLDLSSDEITRRRMVQALKRASDSRSGRLSELRRVLLGEQLAYFRPDQEQPTFFDPHLNRSQQDAVIHALAAEDVAVIHGPPGTGKTTTLVELIRQAVSRGEKVLACAPSNMAIDHLVEKLLEAPDIGRLIRLGHPARVQPHLQEQTLDELVDAHPQSQLARKLRKEAHTLFGRADRFTRAKPLPGEKAGVRREARAMLAEARELERRAVDQILDQAQVVCATTTGLDGQLLGERRFDLAIIDEAGQSVEPGCWIPLGWVDRVVLAGDHLQLPPTIVSVEAAHRGLGISLLERLMNEQGEELARQLTIQYRMHQTIAGFSAAEFYEDTVTAAAEVESHLLVDLAGVAPTSLTCTPITLIDTAGAGYEEEVEGGSRSRLNRQEGELVAAKIEALLAAGVTATMIGVITPYAAQVRFLKTLLPSEIEVNSVDGFQGREKEVIVISLVRSNMQGEIGFLAEQRRMNVALTRARRKLIVIGDSATVTADRFFGRLVDYFDQHGGYRSVWEEMVPAS